MYVYIKRFLSPPLIMVVLTLGLVSSACEKRQPPAVFILSGQSNMVGQGRVADLPDSLRYTPVNVRHIPDGGDDLITFGPELTFAHELAAQWPDREIILLKYAVGGTSLLAWAPDWDSTEAAITGDAGDGPLYSNLLKRIEEAGVADSGELMGVLWMQGESDARFPEVAEQYGANLVVLIERLRADLDAPSLPFIVGRVNPPEDHYFASPEVRQGQLRVANTVSNVMMVDADGLSKWEDNLHYDTEGILELGRRFARVFFELSADRARAP